MSLYKFAIGTQLSLIIVSYAIGDIITLYVYMMFVCIIDLLCHRNMQIKDRILFTTIRSYPLVLVLALYKIIGEVLYEFNINDGLSSDKEMLMKLHIKYSSWIICIGVYIVVANTLPYNIVDLMIKVIMNK